MKPACCCGTGVDEQRAAVDGSGARKRSCRASQRQNASASLGETTVAGKHTTQGDRAGRGCIHRVQGVDDDIAVGAGQCHVHRRGPVCRSTDGAAAEFDQLGDAGVAGADTPLAHVQTTAGHPIDVIASGVAATVNHHRRGVEHTAGLVEDAGAVDTEEQIRLVFSSRVGDRVRHVDRPAGQIVRAEISGGCIPPVTEAEILGHVERARGLVDVSFLTATFLGFDVPDIQGSGVGDVQRTPPQVNPAAANSTDCAASSSDGSHDATSQFVAATEADALVDHDRATIRTDQAGRGNTTIQHQGARIVRLGDIACTADQATDGEGIACARIVGGIGGLSDALGGAADCGGCLRGDSAALQRAVTDPNGVWSCVGADRGIAFDPQNACVVGDLAAVASSAVLKHQGAATLFGDVARTSE